jgi:hypothetical protein
MRLLVLGCVVVWAGRAFHYIEPFAAKQLIRRREITPLFA